MSPVGGGSSHTFLTPSVSLLMPVPWSLVGDAHARPYLRFRASKYLGECIRVTFRGKSHLQLEQHYLAGRSFSIPSVVHLGCRYDMPTRSSIQNRTSPRSSICPVSYLPSFLELPSQSCPVSIIARVVRWARAHLFPSYIDFLGRPIRDAEPGGPPQLHGLAPFSSMTVAHRSVFLVSQD